MPEHNLQTSEPQRGILGLKHQTIAGKQGFPPDGEAQMIRYDLKCEQEHAFDSWFAGAAAFDRLAQSGHVTCPICGSTRIEKALMAPAVTTRDVAAPLSTPRDPKEEALSELRRTLEANSEYVGTGFATEARAMHEGHAPTRAIYGEAKLQEARDLIEEGIPVLPLPFLPPRKTN